MDITRVIKKHGYTVKEVAAALGQNRVTLSLTMKGNPTVSTLRRISDVIGCDIAEFFADECTFNAAGEQIRHVCPHCGKSLRVHIE